VATICFTEVKMFSFNLFGYEFKFHKETRKLHSIGAEAKVNQSLEKIKNGLDQIEARQIKYSEYRLQIVSGVSINTIKKYRDEITKYREESNSNLFN